MTSTESGHTLFYHQGSSPQDTIDYPQKRVPTEMEPMLAEDRESYDDSKPQYAAVKPELNSNDPISPVGSEIIEKSKLKFWDPIPLRPWFIIPLLVGQVLGGIAIEIALHFSKHSNGWPVISQVAGWGSAHFIYTIPPVLISVPIVASWAWIDLSLKKLQPYVDLANGSATAERSIMLNYLETSRFRVWMDTLRHRHYLVTITTILCLFTMLIEPITAGMFVVIPTSVLTTTDNILSTNQFGLNTEAISNLLAFNDAAGFVNAQALYNLSIPPFILSNWTIASFTIPDVERGTNGTIQLNTTAIETGDGCEVADSTTVVPQGLGFTIIATWSGCSINITVPQASTVDLGFAPLTNCPAFPTTDLSHLPIMIYFASQANFSATAPVSVTFCQPTIVPYMAQATADLVTGGLLGAQPLPIRGSTALNQPPLNGQALNGMAFSGQATDPYTTLRASSIPLQVVDAIYQKAVANSNVQTVFQGDTLYRAARQVYTTYLTLFALQLYFTPNPQQVAANVFQVVPRLFLTPYACHIISVALIIMSIIGAGIYWQHRRQRRTVRLSSEPGTLGSAIALAGQTELAFLLEGRDDDKVIKGLLKPHRFKLDPERGKIILEQNPEMVSITPPLTSPNAKARRRKSRLFKGSKTDEEIDHTEAEYERERRRRLSRMTALYSQSPNRERFSGFFPTTPGGYSVTSPQGAYPPHSPGYLGAVGSPNYPSSPSAPLNRSGGYTPSIHSVTGRSEPMSV